MEEILRFAVGKRWDPDVEQWLAEQDAELRPIALTWFSRLRECGEDVVELIHDGCPVALVGDAPFAYVNVFKAHVNLGFFRGAYLDDRNGLLQGSGRHMRHIKLRSRLDANPPSEQLLELIEGAYQDILRYVR